jgi:hypothetical protein
MTVGGTRLSRASGGVHAGTSAQQDGPKAKVMVKKQPVSERAQVTVSDLSTRSVDNFVRKRDSIESIPLLARPYTRCTLESSNATDARQNRLTGLSQTGSE